MIRPVWFQKKNLGSEVFSVYLLSLHIFKKKKRKNDLGNFIEVRYLFNKSDLTKTNSYRKKTSFRQTVNISWIIK